MRPLVAHVVIGVIAAAASCSTQSTESVTERAGRSDGEASAPAPAPATDVHEEHGDHGDEEGLVDLDRPVEELLAASCEHRVKTYECDECRYEVGVAKAPASLFDGGLLELTKVERRRVEVPLRLTGEVQFDERLVAHVSSQVEGIVRAIHVTLGDRVEAGQALVEVESTDVGAARVTHYEAQGRLKLARATSDRLETLRAEGIASERELLDARRALEAAEIEAEGARATLGYLGISAREGPAGGPSKGIARGRVALRSPLSGTVLQMHAVSGELAEVGESILTVGDNTTLWVWADLHERDMAEVLGAQASKRLAAVVSVEAFGDEEFPGTVDFVSPAMDESSRTAKLRIVVPNPGGRLLAGMFAKVKVFTPAPLQETALAVPRDAVLEDAGRAFVFVRHHDDYFVRRPVEVGRAFAGWVEITEGLSEGATVVGRGAFLLKSDVLRSKMGAGCAD
jgi:cobalt-zinc-cadmium efflux system membrane fusion protein